jgi:hypothetical protein
MVLVPKMFTNYIQQDYFQTQSIFVQATLYPRTDRDSESKTV